MRVLEAELRRLLESGVRALGFDLVNVELHGRGAHSTLRVYIDGPHGVSVDDCANVSRQLSAILDVEDPIPGSYTLEVSSPGLDRPLVTLEDFRRFSGETVKLRTHEAVGGRRNFTGRLAGVRSERVLLDLDDAAGGETQQVELELNQIERARLVPKF